jgi:hypothetical protein
VNEQLDAVRNGPVDVVVEPVRIFIGVSANDEDLEFAAVLHYTLEKYAIRPLDVTWMRLSRNPRSFWFADPQRAQGWITKSWHTPFSALRWGIPAFCGFQGRAIYLDIDMILRDDIAKLWDQKFRNGAGMIARNPAIDVTMFDCAAMKRVLPPIEQIRKAGVYREIRRKVLGTPSLIQQYTGGNWNCQDLRKMTGGEYASIDDPDIKVLHFTRVATQPHLRHALPRLHKQGRKHWYEYNRQEPVQNHHRKDALVLFDRLLDEAQKEGYTLDRYRNPEGLFGEYAR